ncbi:Cro/CI family transcriptional regulator [Acinetobacter sp.]|uniref:Cro/CI family transcriptional regulator n=1 Tax=Acinetobacter sp. TaxID=472 RepID=UPI00388D76E4
MTKQEALNLLQVNGVQLAELLGIKPAAVYQWPQDKIPLAREYQIKDLAAGREPIKKNCA